MPLRIYICDIVHDPLGGMLGLGQSRAAFHDVLSGRGYSTIEDMRGIIPSTVGKLLVRADDISDADHAVAKADARIVALPFEDASGASIGLEGLLGGIPLAKRTALISALENHHVPVGDALATWSVRKVLNRMVRRFRLRRKLGGDDLAEGLDTLLSAIPAARRTVIRDKLIAQGFNTVGLVGTLTIRQAIFYLVEQSTVSGLASEYD